MRPSDYVAQKYHNYSLYVNQNRAIPDARDGLKSGQRIALYIMRNKASKIKTIALAGEMIAKELYVHGDAAASESISQLAAPYKNNVPLLSKQGNFGTLVKPGDFASPRYTYVQKPSYANNLIYVDYDIVPMTENHDGSREMPEYFLPLIPIALLNGVEGVGVGYRSRIMPRNLNDLANAVVKCIRGQKSALPKMEPCFDYMNSQRGKFVKYNNNGGSVYEFRGSINIDSTSQVTVTNIPAMNITVESFKKKLDEMIEDGSIRDYEDHSSSSIKIVIKFRRGQLAKMSEEDILSYLGLIKEAAETLVVTRFDGQGIIQYQYDKNEKYSDPVERYIREWVEWRFVKYMDRFKDLIQKANEELLYLLCVKACFDHSLPDRISKKRDRADMKNDIIHCAKKSRLTATDEIADKISARASYSWTKASYNELLEKIMKLQKDIKEYNSYLKSESKRKDLFVTEVTGLKSLKV